MLWTGYLLKAERACQANCWFTGVYEFLMSRLVLCREATLSLSVFKELGFCPSGVATGVSQCACATQRGSGHTQKSCRINSYKVTKTFISKLNLIIIFAN